MTETQKKYKSTEQAEFEEKLLNDPAAFAMFARAYMEKTDVDGSFLEWCWEIESKMREIPEDAE